MHIIIMQQQRRKKKKKKHEKGPKGSVTNIQTEAQTLHPTAPIIDRIDEIIEMVNGNIDRIGLQYDMLSGMFFYF